MHKRLYIIEGLPCSGKSTTSEYVAKLLGERGRVCCIDEGSGAHPADFEFHAYLTGAVLSDSFSAEEQADIRSQAERIADGFAVPLSGFEGDMFDRLVRYKIYDALPWETEMPVMLEKWQHFCDTAESDTVYVFNCVLLQNPMCETMMRFGFTGEQSCNYISRIAEIIRSMEPVVIYLKNNDIAESVLRTSSEREGWLEAVTEYHVSGAYGRSIGAQGFDGYIRCLEERQRRELDILSRLQLDSIVIEDPHKDWQKTYNTIREYI